MTAYITIERQYGPDLAIEYPTIEAATAALTGSPFIDGLCEDDCLDAYVAVSVAHAAEHITPPAEPEPKPADVVDITGAPVCPTCGEPGMRDTGRTIECGECGHSEPLAHTCTAECWPLLVRLGQEELPACDPWTARAAHEEENR